MAGPTIWDSLAQVFPGKPKFTEKDLPNLQGKVYLITGANTGLGKLLSQLLYAKNAKVYMTARSSEKGLNAIASIKEAVPVSQGELVFLQLDLADLASVRTAAHEFLAKEPRLDVLFNNAGVMLPPDGEKTAQGFDAQVGVNCVGPFLFTKLLAPRLAETAKHAPAGSVRVVWVSSSAAETPFVPKGGADSGNFNYEKKAEGNFARYCISKSINYLEAVEFAQRFESDGVVSVALNPGNLQSDLWRWQSRFVAWLTRTFFLHPVINGVYTELFAGLSPDVTLEKTGGWIGPWGRFFPIRQDLAVAAKPMSEGGIGRAKEFAEWCEEQIRPYSE